MAEHSLTPQETIEKFRADLREAAILMREADHIDPEQQEALADLVAELGTALDPAIPPEYTAHLVESSTALVHALREPHDEGLLSSARHRLEEAATRAEADAPLATNVVRRLINTLANLGI